MGLKVSGDVNLHTYTPKTNTLLTPYYYDHEICISGQNGLIYTLLLCFK